MPVQLFGATDKGLVRSENEDSFLIFEPSDESLRQEKGALAIVADGVGGSSGGKQASRMAVEIIKENYYRLSARYSLGESLQIANSQIHTKARREQKERGLATTCTAVAVKGQVALISHIGDSRAYLFRAGKLSQITEDHTLVEKLVKEGLITAEEAKTHPRRNVIIKALGSGDEIEPDNLTIQLAEGDLILISSDGLHGLVWDAEIESSLSMPLTLEERAGRLIKIAMDRGGTDNITVVIISLSGKAKSFGDTKPLAESSPGKASWMSGNKIGFLAGLIILAAIAGMLIYQFGHLRNDPPAPDNFEEVIRVN